MLTRLALKPANVTGTESLTPYEELMPLLQIQDPALQTLGVIYSSSEDTGIFGAERIAEIAEAMGITVQSVPVSTLKDLHPATRSLLDGGVDALLLPLDSITGIGLPTIVRMSNAYSVPIFYPHGLAVQLGATISLGAIRYYSRGGKSGAYLSRAFEWRNRHRPHWHLYPSTILGWASIWTRPERRVSRLRQRCWTRPLA